MTTSTNSDGARPPADLSPLFTPLTIGSMTIRNRFAMAPMTRAKSPGGVPNEENVDHYRQRAAGGVGLIVTEGTYVRGPAAGPLLDVPHVYGDAAAAGWGHVVEAVHAEGAAIFAQLWHLGVLRGATPAFEPDAVSVSPSGLDLDGNPAGRALADADLRAVHDAFVESAVVAQRAGFDGVELHGAHGYLLDQFTWSVTNRRADAYAGSISARSRFPAEVVASIRAEVGPSFPIGYRFSQWKANHYDATLVDNPAELEQMLTPLTEAGVDVFHVSTRRHALPAFDTAESLTLAGWTKRITGRAVITVGSVGVDTAFRADEHLLEGDSQDRLHLLTDQFERGEFDIVAVGRALLADPAWVDKQRQGRIDEIVRHVTPR